MMKIVDKLAIWLVILNLLVLVVSLKFQVSALQKQQIETVRLIESQQKTIAGLIAVAQSHTNSLSQAADALNSLNQTAQMLNAIVGRR